MNCHHADQHDICFAGRGPVFNMCVACLGLFTRGSRLQTREQTCRWRGGAPGMCSNSTHVHTSTRNACFALCDVLFSTATNTDAIIEHVVGFLQRRKKAEVETKVCICVARLCCRYHGVGNALASERGPLVGGTPVVGEAEPPAGANTGRRNKRTRALAVGGRQHPPIPSRRGLVSAVGQQEQVWPHAHNSMWGGGGDVGKKRPRSEFENWHG